MAKRRRMWTAVGALAVVVALAAGWYQFKMAVANTMVAIGVDWPNMSDGDKLNAAIGFIIGGIGIGLGVLGYRVTKRQGEIAEIQHKIMEEQSARKAVLRLMLRGWQTDVETVEFFETTESTYELAVRNSGKRAAKIVSWRIDIVDDPRLTVTPFDGFDTTALWADGDGDNVMRGHGFIGEPVLPGGITDLGVIHVRGPGGQPIRPKIKWLLRWDDGVFPEEGKELLEFPQVGTEGQAARS